MNPDRRLWLYAGLALAAGVGLATAAKRQDGAAQPPPAGRRGVGPTDRILLFGDSLAVGLKAPLGQLAADARVDLLADARSGTRISQWNKNSWLAADLAARPTLALVSLGTNDMLLPDPTVEKPDLVALIERLRVAGAEVVWIMPPTMPFPDRGLRAMIVAAAPTVFRSDALEIPRGPDKIHPTASGYAGWAGALWKGLADLPRAIA